MSTASQMLAIKPHFIIIISHYSNKFFDKHPTPSRTGKNVHEEQMFFKPASHIYIILMANDSRKQRNSNDYQRQFVELKRLSGFAFKLVNFYTDG